MKRTLLVAAILAATAPAMGQATDDHAEKDVVKLSQQITNALVKGDTTFLDGVMADDWILIGSDGEVVDKEKQLRDIKDGTLNFDAMDKSQMKVRIYGDAAVVTGLIRAKIRLKGQEVGNPLGFTEVFIRRQGKWRTVSAQVTPVAAESKGEKP